MYSLTRQNKNKWPSDLNWHKIEKNFGGQDTFWVTELANVINIFLNFL